MLELTYMNNPLTEGHSPLPAGPWDAEPDKVQWVDRETRLDCLALRNHWGSWCGYVGLQEWHPLFEVEYMDVPYVFSDVHGGLTFSDLCMEDERPQGQRVCHIPPPGSSDRVWWLGFDCGHSGDLIPGMIRHHESFLRANPQFRGLHLGETYKDLRYVQREVTSLARQLGWFIPRDAADRTARLALPPGR